MPPLLSISILALVAFCSTNIDDLLVLMTFFSDARYRGRDIVIGQYAGMATLFGVSLLGIFCCVVIPGNYLGLLAAVPIVMGCRALFKLTRNRGGPPIYGRLAPMTRGGTAMVAIVTIGNGGDNIAVYILALTHRQRWEIAVTAMIFTLLTGVYCCLAYWLVLRSAAGMRLRRYSLYVTPFVWIGLGSFVIYREVMPRLHFGF